MCQSFKYVNKFYNCLNLHNVPTWTKGIKCIVSLILAFYALLLRSLFWTLCDVRTSATIHNKLYEIQPQTGNTVHITPLPSLLSDFAMIAVHFTENKNVARSICRTPPISDGYNNPNATARWIGLVPSGECCLRECIRPAARTSRFHWADVCSAAKFSYLPPCCFLGSFVVVDR